MERNHSRHNHIVKSEYNELKIIWRKAENEIKKTLQFELIEYRSLCVFFSSDCCAHGDVGAGFLFRASVWARERNVKANRESQRTKRFVLIMQIHFKWLIDEHYWALSPILSTVNCSLRFSSNRGVTIIESVLRLNEINFKSPFIQLIFRKRRLFGGDCFVWFVLLFHFQKFGVSFAHATRSFAVDR